MRVPTSEDERLPRARDRAVHPPAASSAQGGPAAMRARTMAVVLACNELGTMVIITTLILNTPWMVVPNPCQTQGAGDPRKWGESREFASTGMLSTRARQLTPQAAREGSWG